MNVYRRNGFRSWFEDVGYLYIIVTVLVVLCFAGLGLKARFRAELGSHATSQVEIAATMASEDGLSVGRL